MGNSFYEFFSCLNFFFFVSYLRNNNLKKIIFLLLINSSISEKAIVQCNKQNIRKYWNEIAATTTAATAAAEKLKLLIFQFHSLESEFSGSEFCFSISSAASNRSMMLLSPIKYPSSWLPTSQFCLWVIWILSGTGPVFAKSINQQLACLRSWRKSKELPMISCDLKNSECSKVARMALRRWMYRGWRQSKKKWLILSFAIIVD